MKELRCKKCKKLLGIQEGTRVTVKGEINMEFKRNSCIFICIRCGQKNKFSITPLTK